MKLVTFLGRRDVMKSIHEAQGVGNLLRKAPRDVNEFKPPSHDKETINTAMCLTDLAQSCDAKGISKRRKSADRSTRKFAGRPCGFDPARHDRTGDGVREPR